jgi:hypothetical protein
MTNHTAHTTSKVHELVVFTLREGASRNEFLATEASMDAWLGSPGSCRDPAVAVACDGSADLRLPGAGPVAGFELPPCEAGAIVGFGAGCLPGVLEATAPVTSHAYEHTYGAYLIHTFVLSASQGPARRAPFLGSGVHDDGSVPLGAGAMSDQGEPCRLDVLQIEASYHGTQATLTLLGEFDMTGTERFWSFLSEALSADPKTVTIDASGLEFID